MMYENFRHTHGSGSGAGENKFCVLPDNLILVHCCVYEHYSVLFASLAIKLYCLRSDK